MTSGRSSGALSFSVGLWTRLVRRQRLITVVCFHRVSPVDYPHYPPVRPETFARLLGFFRRHYSVVSPKDLRSNEVSSKPRLLITFDDGYRDFLDYALPALRLAGLPAVMFVVTGVLDTGRSFPWLAFMDAIARMGSADRDRLAAEMQIASPSSFRTIEDWCVRFTHTFQELEPHAAASLARKYLVDEDYRRTPMLSWDDIRSLAGMGITVGSHTHTHQSLDKVPIAEARAELELSRKRLVSETGAPVDFLAFPSGRYDESVVEAATAAGYAVPFSVGVGLNRGSSRVMSRTLVYGSSWPRVVLRSCGLTEVLNAFLRRRARRQEGH